MNNIKKKLIIFAPNIMKGGGLVLIQELIINKPLYEINWMISKSLNNYNDLKSDLFGVGIFERIRAEYLLFKKAKNKDTVICFNGSVPLLPISGKIIVYLQNRLLIESYNLSRYNYYTKIRLIIERYFLRFHWRRIDFFLVQTESMKEQLLKFAEKYNLKNRKITISPFSRVLSSKNYSHNKLNNFSFIYPSNLQPHKNHLNLIKAWKLFNSNLSNSNLILTITKEQFFNICKINKLSSVNFEKSIKCIGDVSHEKIIRIMSECNAIIFPSMLESYGLPLIEAKQINLPIIAAELDYVRDICMPEQTFDPNSVKSIYRALCRFCNLEYKISEIHNASKFWSNFEK